MNIIKLSGLLLFYFLSPKYAFLINILLFDILDCDVKNYLSFYKNALLHKLRCLPNVCKIKCPDSNYQAKDKLTDIILYIFSLKYLYNPVLLFLLIFRIIGTIIFFLTNNPGIFLFFPNFFESAYLFYSFGQKNIIILIFLFSLKIYQEYKNHIIDG